MTKDEVYSLLVQMKYTFPSFKLPHPVKEKTDLEAVVVAWYAHLATYDKDVVFAAYKGAVASSDDAFSPSVSQILGQIRKMNRADAKSDIDAWNGVLKALRNSTYNSEEEFSKLDETTQRTIGSSNILRSWGMCSEYEVNTVIMSQFLKNYKVMCERVETQALIPTELRLAVQKKFLLVDENNGKE